MTARSRAGLLAAHLLVASGVLLATTAPAMAADLVRVSTDGSTWAATLDAPLFDPDVRWVPGDERTETFFVRNGAATAGTLALDTDEIRDPALSDDLHVAARIGDSDWIPVADSGSTEIGQVPADSDARIDIRVAFAGSAQDVTQARLLTLDFAVRLTEADRSGGPEPDQPADGAGSGGTAARAARGALARTGTEFGWQLATAGGLLGTGVALVARRRRQEDRDVAR